MALLQRQVTSDERIVVDYVSPHGPTVTHVRGIVMSQSLQNLRSAGMYDEYLEYMPAADLEVLAQSIATSWIPVHHVSKHYQACDRLGLSAAHMERFGRLSAERVASTFLGLFLRRARAWGVDGFRLSIAQQHRLTQRMWCGGCTSVIEIGPKEYVIEDRGVPFAASRCYREGSLAFMRHLASLLCRVAYVRLVPARMAQHGTVAVALSWV